MCEDGGEGESECVYECEDGGMDEVRHHRAVHGPCGSEEGGHVCDQRQSNARRQGGLSVCECVCEDECGGCVCEDEADRKYIQFR